jgi:hypothetical protein
MYLSQIRDIVRENVGRDKVSEHFLTWALDMGRREIEKEGNFWWMKSTKSWNTIINQQDYLITGSAGGGLNLPNWKDERILLTSDSSITNPGWDEVYGPKDVEDIQLIYNDADQGQPEVYSVDGNNDDTAIMRLYPALPDKVYAMQFYHYQWTSNPVTATGTDALLTRFPEALIYMATSVAMVELTKDPGMGAYWKSLFNNPQDGELRKIKRYNISRDTDSRFELYPRKGGIFTRAFKRREIWI